MISYRLMLPLIEATQAVRCLTTKVRSSEINTAIYSPSEGSVGIGFAIPSDLARPIIEQILKYGRTKRGWLGVQIQDVSKEIAESLGLDKPKGALVARISAGSPASEAKFEPGDVILEFNGKPVDAMRSLPRIVADTPVDSVVSVKVWRGRKEISLDVSVGELKEEQVSSQESDENTQSKPVQKSVVVLGMTLDSVNGRLRRRYDLSAKAKGVVVTAIKPGSAAASGRIQPGDILLEVDQAVVQTPGDVATSIDRARNKSLESLLILLERRGDHQFVPLSLKKKG